MESTSNDYQFYPTPKRLAKRMWDLFADRDFSRVLDPSAGDGALAAAAPEDYERRRRHCTIDCIELDVSKHPLLRDKGFNVVGLDFLAFEGGEVYSHIIMNPPFADGAKHVLKAWDCLWEGEIVALLNAQTLRNPCNIERQRLADLVQQHGSVKFIADAFKGAEVAREAEVEVALVHLVKPAECAEDWIGPVIEKLMVDRAREDDFELPRELALPQSFVSNQVAAFRAAVRAMRESVRMEAVACHFANRVGKTMADLANERGQKNAAPADGVRASLEKRYLDLKDRAWASVLRSTETLSKLSAKVQRQAESQFEDIKKLEFNESNVYGFLLGLVQSQPQMQLDMACDVFDQITRYWSENTVFYRGWKSNDKHRTCGMRIKTTRFIIPGHQSDSWRSGAPWETLRQLADFDKVFSTLDGKSAPEVSLCNAFESNLRTLREGGRVSSSYFDLRWHPGVGTLHLFPRDKALIDRLNRVVGRHRQWLPPETERVPEQFWLQFNKAEKFDRELREEARKLARSRQQGYFSTWDHPMNQFMHQDGERSGRAGAVLAEAIDNVLAKHGLLLALEDHRTAGQPLLLAA
jgi:hypothetical protein